MAKKSKQKTHSAFKVDGVAFNKNWILKLESEEAFITEMSGKGYAHIYANNPERENKLREVYALANKGKKAEA